MFGQIRHKFGGGGSTALHRAHGSSGAASTSILASTLTALFGGYGMTATILAGVLAVGIGAVFYHPETKGEALPT